LVTRFAGLASGLNRAPATEDRPPAVTNGPPDPPPEISFPRNPPRLPAAASFVPVMARPIPRDCRIPPEPVSPFVSEPNLPRPLKMLGNPSDCRIPPEANPGAPVTDGTWLPVSAP